MNRMLLLSRSSSLRASLIACTACATLAVSGCGIGSVVTSNSTDTIAGPIAGILHGGPNPVVGARVVIYATTSTGYGVGSALQEATQTGAALHQDTDSNGNFSFAGGYTCPAGQYAYIAAYGGNTGAGNNPNSVFVAPLGACSSLYSGTTYTGPSVWIDELTTVATGYALANFTTVTGDAVNGYTVGIGAPATNNAAAGCVANGYYPSCSATVSAGLKHAVANALALVNNNTGQVNASTTNGAVIPTVELNTLADIMQTCVNSTGGGTGSNGLPTTTTTSSGTSHDGTLCGKFFAFSSYTNTGLATGALTAPGNTLDAIKNLAKRPTGTASTFDSSCDSNSGTGATTAVACLFALAPSNGFYGPSLTSAPPDWMVGISYLKGAFSNSTTNIFSTTATPACASTTTGDGLLYPQFTATDINDNVVILNTDQSIPVCGNVIAIGSDGTTLGVSTVDNTMTAVATITLDSWGHAILPVKGSNGVRFYQYAAGGAADPGDAAVTLDTTVVSPATSGTTVTSAYKGFYAVVDGTNRVYVAAANGVNDWGYLSPTTLSHAAPAYGTTALGTTTSNLLNVAVDINNNAATSKSTFVFGTGAGGTTFTNGGTSGGTNFATVSADTTGNFWQVVNNGSTLGTSQTTVIKYPYTASAGIITWGTNTTAASPTYAFPVNSTTTLNDGLDASIKMAVMDGNNVMWWPDFFGSSSVTPPYGSFLRGYDTVNNYGTSQLQGCKTIAPSTYAISAWSITASTSTTFTTAGSPPSVGSTLPLSAFPTSTFFNGQVVTVTANVTTSPYSFTVANTFSQATSSSTESGTATSRSGTACGSNSGDGPYPSNVPYLIYQSRGIAVDSMGNLWIANGTQSQVNEILGIAAPTLPNYIHNGVSNKP